MIQRDKLLHFVVGFIICLLFSQVHLALGTTATIVVAYLKEFYDSQHPHKHTYDGWDAYATCVGIVPAQLLMFAL